MSRAGDMKIKLNLDGLTGIVRSFAQLKDAGETSAKSLKKGGEDAAKSVRSIGDAAVAAGRRLTSIGSGIKDLSISGFDRLYNVLRDTEALARQVAEEIDELQKRANSFNVEDGRTIGGLRFAAANEGAQDANVEKGLVALADLAEAAANGEEIALQAFSSIGARYGDLFDEMGNTLKSDQIFLNVSELFSKLPPEANRTAIAIELFGKKIGPDLVTLLNRGRSGIEEYISEYNKLRGIADGDVDLVGAFKGQQDRTAAAFDGLRTAVARGFLPALQAVDRELELFYTEQRGAAELFGQVTGQFVLGIVPKLLEVGRALALIATGQAGLVADGPLKTFMLGGIQLAQDFGNAILDLLSYLTSGDLDAAPQWLQSTVKFGKDAVEAGLGLVAWARDMSDIWSGTLKPALDKLFETVSSVYGLLGVDEPASQLAITAALVIFGGTVATIVTKLGTLTAAMVAATGAGTALAGFVGLGAAAAGLGFTAVSAQNFDAQVQEATRIAKELAETEGEAYAASYLKTFLETVPQEFRGAQLANSAVSFLTGGRGGYNIEETVAKLDVIISAGGVEESAAGVRRALADLGLTRAEDGTISGAAGYDLAAKLKIAEVQLTPEAQAQLDAFRALAAERGIVPPGAGDRISQRFASGGFVRGPGTGTSDSILARLSNGEFVMRAAAVRRYGLGLLEGLNDLRLPGFALGGLVSPAAVPAPAMLIGSGGTPVHLTLPGLGEYQLSARADVAEDLLRAARKAKRSRL